MKDIIAQGMKKNLKVRKNSFNVGWCITLPNGSTHCVTTDAELVTFIRGY